MNIEKGVVVVLETQRDLYPTSSLVEFTFDTNNAGVLTIYANGTGVAAYAPGKWFEARQAEIQVL